MKWLKSRSSSLGGIAALIPILSILFMPPWTLADDGDNGHKAVLYGIAADTWKFYAADIDPNTHLPMDNLTWAGGGPLSGQGQYTSASNIGVYLWAVVAANDLNLVSRSTADSLVSATLTEVATCWIASRACSISGTTRPMGTKSATPAILTAQPNRRR